MQAKPNLLNDRIIARLHEAYGLYIADVAFLPLGADFNTAVYCVTAEDERSYFLKLRRGAFDEITVTLPRFLRNQGILLECMNSTRTRNCTCSIATIRVSLHWRRRKPFMRIAPSLMMTQPVSPSRPTVNTLAIVGWAVCGDVYLARGMASQE